MNDETTVNETASEELILGKFKNNEEVVKAYQELEKKLGEKSAEKRESDQKVSPKKESNSDIAELRKEIEALKASQTKAKKPLEDNEFRKRVAEGLSKLPNEKVQEINKRINDGSVSESELQVYASLADKAPESSDQISFEGQKESTMNDMDDEYYDIIKNKADVWCNPNHPEYAKVVERKAFLAKKLGY